MFEHCLIDSLYLIVVHFKARQIVSAVFIFSNLAAHRDSKDLSGPSLMANSPPCADGSEKPTAMTKLGIGWYRHKL